MLRCTGCDGDVDQLTDVRRPICSTCQPRRAQSIPRAHLLEAEAMERVAEVMRREVDTLAGSGAESAIGSELAEWANRLCGAATVRRVVG